jgi:hypothetical protein
MSTLRARAEAIITAAREKQIEERSRPPERQRAPQRTMQFKSKRTEIDAHFAKQWETRWRTTANAVPRRATTWKSEWQQQPLSLYEGLQKHEATALFLLRAEVLGLNDWLARIGVPDVLLGCQCGAARQTLTHILAFCRDQIEPRIRLLDRAGTTELEMILTDPKKVQWAARWLLETGTLGQFTVALEVEKEEMEGWAAFQALRDVPE